MKLLKSFLLAATLLFTTATVAHAADSFTTSLTATYTVHSNGKTTVSQAFTLTNKTPTLFVKQYSLEYGSTQLENVKVTTDKGDLPANVVTTENKTSIGITFDDVVVGEGKSRKFTIQFDTADVAIISGNVLEVYIPKVNDSHQYEEYQVALKIPEQFGNPARVSPPEYVQTHEPGFSLLKFTNPKGTTITALFGQKQIFDYTLHYHLTNSTGNTGIAQIALPPDTLRQKVEYLNLEPQPESVTADPDGNWIATYEIAAQKELEVLLTGKAYIYLEDQPSLPLYPPTPEHTKSQKYWEVDNNQIKELAQKYKTPKEIYDYVVGALHYNYDKTDGAIERLGAVKALNEPSDAVCQEFTDLFVATARAAGIPARRATGYAYTENSRLRPLSLVQDILHTWPEYYDAEKKTWIPVDPTWGNTTGGVDYFNQFDFNHFTFAHNGVSSQTPYGAGSYRKEIGGKDVEVSFGKNKEMPAAQFGVKIQRRSFWKNLFKNEYSIWITNDTGVAWYNIPISLGSSSLNTTLSEIHGEQGSSVTQLDYLLPYQTRELTFGLNQNPWWQPRNLDLTVTLQGISSSHAIKTGFQISEVARDQTVIAVGVGGGLVIFAVLSGSLLVLRRARHRALRRKS
jgi:hypothetical protein